jgi:hypothetical protein
LLVPATKTYIASGKNLVDSKAKGDIKAGMDDKK